MHNAALTALGLNWRYLACEAKAESGKRKAEMGIARDRRRESTFDLLPLLLAIKMVDVLDESARTWGAVNTIRFEARDEHGEWLPVGAFAQSPAGEIRAHGFNTDAAALTQSLRENLDLEPAGAKVLLPGAGGAGRTAALKLATEGVAELYLLNRTRAKAQAVADEIRQRWPGVRVSLDCPAGAVDLALNATSLGLRAEDALPFDPEKFSLHCAAAAYDMIYRPAETPFLHAARAAGARAANGLGMLLYQGAKALEIWTDQPAPVAVMRRALEANIYGN